MAVPQDKTRVLVTVRKEDIDYLKEVSRLSGISVSEITGCLLTDFVLFLRKVLGDDLRAAKVQCMDKGEYFLRQVVRFALGRLVALLEEFDNPIEGGGGS